MFHNTLSDLLKNKCEDNKSFFNKDEYILWLQEEKLYNIKLGNTIEKKNSKNYIVLYCYNIIL